MSIMSFTRGESIALWTGVIIFLILISCLFYRLCSVTCRTMISNMGSTTRKKRLNPMEKRVNKILNNESAREILKAHALTAINSQVRKGERNLGIENKSFTFRPTRGGRVTPAR